MPRIPLYNKGQGPAAQLATGQLSPRADVGAFTAPGQASARLGKAASDIAFNFLEAERDVERQAIYAEKTAEVEREAGELERNPKAQSVRGFEIEFGEFKNKKLSEIDALDLSRSQKIKMKSDVGSFLDRKLATSRPQVHNKFQEKRSTQFNEAIASLLPSAENLQMRDTVLADINQFISTGRELGLKLNYSKESVNFEIQNRDILAASIDPSKTADDLKVLKDKILNGEGEFEELDARQRSSLVTPLKSRITDLEFGQLADLKAQQDDALAELTATGDSSAIGSVVSGYRSANRPDLANSLESKAYVVQKMFNLSDDLSFATESQALQVMAEINNLPVSGPNAAENAEVKMLALERFAARQELIDTDPAQYVVQQLQKKGKEVTPVTILATQSQMGIKQNPYTNAQVQQVQDGLKDMSELERIESLRNFVLGAGEANETLVLSLMPRYGFSLAQQSVASDPFNPINADLLASQSTDEKSIKEVISKEIMQNIVSLTTDELAPYVSSIPMTSSDASDHKVQVQQTVSKLAMYLVAFGGQEEGEAVKKAARIITDRYVFPSVNGKTFILPRKYQNSSSAIESELNQILKNPETLKDVAVGRYEGDVTGDISRSTYAQNVRQGGRWVTTGDRSSVVLVDDTDNIVETEQGQPIKFSFTEVLSRISEKQKRAQSIEEMERELENINLKLRDEYTGISIARAEAAGEFEKFEAEKLQLKFRRDALRDMIKTEKGRK